MGRSLLGVTAGIAILAIAGAAQQAPSAGPYKILKTAKVGGLGGFDYIQADDSGRRLYIPRGAVQGDQPMPGRVTIFNLDTLAPAGEIANTRANGAAVDAKSGHGFASSSPVAMWDLKTETLIKTIDLDAKTRPDGIMADPFNQRIYVFSHPTMDATVVDAKDGKVLGIVDLGGAPEQAVSDGKGHVYAVIQDKSNVAVIDAATMKVTAHYDFAGKGSRCNGLALDAKNGILFAACGQSGNPPAPQPQMVIMDAKDGKVLTTLPLAGSSDGAVFNPKTMEVFSTHGNGTLTVVKENSPTNFEVEQNLQTMPGAKCVTLDAKTGHILTMAAEYGPAPAPAATPEPGRGGRGARGPMLADSFTILVIGK